MKIQILFPGGKRKACTLSYDDGEISDRYLVELFNQYEIRATFHLNSGTIGTKGFVQEEEMVALYMGHEVACHGKTHADFTQLSQTGLIAEILEDRKKLESIVKYQVRGMSYPFGLHSEKSEHMAQALGIEYSRTVEDTYGFDFPSDFMNWNPTCHHKEVTEELLNFFLESPSYKKLPLLYIWGHSFEFDREKNWKHIENICKILSGQDEIWYATNLQIKEYIMAVRSLVNSVDETLLYNPTGQTIWMENRGSLIQMEPGNTLFI